MSRVIRKPGFCIFENKGADQLCSHQLINAFVLAKWIVQFLFLNPEFQASILFVWLHKQVCVPPRRFSRIVTQISSNYHLSCHMGKATICSGKNKGADQLCSNCEADQRFCFRYTDSTIPLLSKSKISSL